MTTTYTITDGTTPNDVLDMEISESTNEIDECQVLVYGKYADNIALTISDSTPSTVFVGLQKGVEQNDNYDITYKLTVQEKAVEMQYVILTGTAGATSFVKSDTASNLVSWVVGQVNTAYGYTGADAWTVDSGSSSSTSLTIGCYYTNALSFLRKVVVDNLGYKLWFDSINKKVYFRQYFTDRTASPISYISKQEIRDSVKRGCTKVIVIGKNANITGSAGTGNLIRVFSYPTAATTTECTTLATKILSDVQSTNIQYNVVLDESVTCNVADYINLDGTNYVVTKKVTTFDRVTITTGALTTSILDTLGNSITEVSGETVVGSDASWSGGNSNVAANAAAYTEYVWDIKDINMISNAKLDATINSFTKSADVSASTDYLSSISQTASSANYTTYTYFPAGVLTNLGSAHTSISGGAQFYIATLFADFLLNGQHEVEITCEYSTNGSTGWEFATVEFDGVIGPDSGNTIIPFVWTVLIPGNTSTNMYAKFNVYAYTDSHIKVYSYAQTTLQGVTRHTHPVTTTYDRSTTGTPPTTVTVKVNSGSDTTLTPGTPLDIQSLLITGKNIIYVKTPSGSGNQCSVNPSITYQTLGTS